MPSFTQNNRLMQFSCVLAADTLLAQSLQGSEAMSQLFNYRIELYAETGTEIDPSALVGTKATVAMLTTDGDDPRYINGLIAGLEQTSGDTTFDVYSVALVPSLWQLTLATNCRIWQAEAPMAIIKKVIGKYSLSMSDQTDDPPPALDYVTQYNETDFQFITRLCEKYGIFYWFEHTENNNTVVFGNSRNGYAGDSYTTAYAPQGDKQDDLYHSVVSDIRATALMVTGQHSSRDYDFVGKTTFDVGPVSSAQQAGTNVYERFHFPAFGSSSVKSAGQSTDGSTSNSKILGSQKDASDVGFNTFHGRTSCRSLYAASTLTLAQHPREDWNSDYLMTELHINVQQSPTYVGNANVANPFTGAFTGIESTRLFRPTAVTPRPRVLGPQPALVTGASGDEIHPDQYGRIKVQFPWDRLGNSDDTSSCWVRVAQGWAGNGWGQYFWPRVGDEVLVVFMNGDPDDPVVVGSVYNGVNTMPYTMPDMMTRSGVKTRSSKGGGAANANELRFEDKAGSEQIFINAEKDLDFRVENDSRTYVMGQNSSIVDKDHLEQFNGDHHYALKGARKESIGGTFDQAITGAVTQAFSANHGLKVSGDSAQEISGKLGQKVDGAVALQYGDSLSLSVSADMGEKAGQNYALSAGMNAYIKGGLNVTIEAGMELTLKGPGGFITIGPAGVAISGTMVLINSGGAAGSGTPPTIQSPDAPAAPQAPKAPDTADDGTKGTKM